MMRVTLAIFGAALMATVLSSAAVQAQSVSSEAQLRRQSSTDLSAQRHLRRVPIYPREEEHWQPDVVPHYNPGPNAVRVCNAAYVKEYRPSGTVIVPHVSCVWRRG
jgi:Tfp pilus assembly protein PilV